MPRVPRHRRAAGSLEPGRLYHVTNRGVDRCEIFHSDLDRIVFLALFAESCQVFGAVCHAFCLMDTHFHLVVEDARGVLSQMMHRVGFRYARYFNDTRSRRRGGPLFESRFRAELVDSVGYFQDAVSYVLRNPVRTKTPIVSSPDAYRWSSAALVCSDTTPARFCAALLASMDGVDGVLSALPRSRFKVCRDRRRECLEAFASGFWLERDRVLSGRNSERYRQALLAPTPEDQEITRDDAAAPQSNVPRLVADRPVFAGLDLEAILSQIERTCRKLLPTSLLAPTQCFADVVAYTLWRFSSACGDTIADALNVARDRLDDAICEIRGRRLLDPAWYRLLWTIEWALRWRLRAAPHRP